MKKSLEKLAKFTIAVAGLAFFANMCTTIITQQPIESKTLSKQEREEAKKIAGYSEVNNLNDAYQKGLKEGYFVRFEREDKKARQIGMKYIGKPLTGEPLFSQLDETPPSNPIIYTLNQLKEDGYNLVEIKK